MDTDTFRMTLVHNDQTISRIRLAAHELHASVNQHYDHTLPYSYHLDSVVEYVKKYAAEICASDDDVVPLIFGAYFHDSIEDARLTYNNVHKIARTYMDDRQAYMAAEIIYALTNEKGRTRAERANDRYYEGIRSTPYAALCKFADRLANFTYSITHDSGHNPPMREVYAKENPHFVEALTTGLPSADQRLRVPERMKEELEEKVRGRR